jgi:hypothetical protein
MSLHLDNKNLGSLEKLSDTFLAWLAGFIDGDGSIYVRIVKHSQYELNFWISVSVSFTLSMHVYHVLELIYKSLEKKGCIRKGNVVGDVIISDPVFLVKLLTKLIPFLYLKRKQAILLLEIIAENKALKLVPNKFKNLNDPFTEKQVAFLKVCEKIEKLAALNSPGRLNPRRKVTLEIVKQEFITMNKK